MKTSIIWITFLMTAVVFSSCDPGDVNTNFKNYWSSNSLVRMQLRGKVKTLTDANGTTNFNEKGFITSQNYEGGNSMVYEYGSGGQLSSITYTSTSNNTTTTRTRNYTYDSHGKYVVNFNFHLPEAGLTPNLKSITEDNNRIDYVFQGDDLLIISSYDDASDTVIVKYDGKYPKSSSTAWSFFGGIEFASNGMFLKYSEGFTGEDYRDTRYYTFEKDNDYQLLKSIKYEQINGKDTYIRNHVIDYNENKDIISETEEGFTEEYYDYMYDDEKNWTSRKYRYRVDVNSPWSGERTETRTITYW